MTRRDHTAVIAARQLRWIADAWRDLLDQLPTTGTSTSAPGRRTTRETPLPFDPHVSRVIHDVTDWAGFLARVLHDEVTVELPAPTDDDPHRTITVPWTPPEPVSVPGVLRAVANRVGHFTTHPDDGIRETFPDDVAHWYRTVDHAVSPTGQRPTTTRIPCEHRTTTTDGAPGRCPGTYTLVPGPRADLVCAVDSTHRVPMSEWVAGSLRSAQDAGAARLIDRLRG